MAKQPTFNAKLLGADALAAELAKLPAQIERRVLTPAIRRGGRMVITAMRPNIPTRQRRDKHGKRTGLRQSATVKMRKYGRTGVIMAVVGFRWPEGAHAHLVEHGHKMVTHRRRWRGERGRGKVGQGVVVGRVPGNNMMRNAWGKSQGRIKMEVRRKLIEGLRKQADKARGIVRAKVGKARV
jgi:hypothetical protein